MTTSDEHRDEIAAQERLIRSVAFLHDLSRVEVARLIGSSEDVHFEQGAIILREDDAADALYLLASGTVEASVRADGSDRVVTSITAPATFGEFGVLLAERTATVRATTAVQAWRIPRGRFEQLVRERPTLGLSIAPLARAIRIRSMSCGYGATRLSQRRPAPTHQARL